MNFFIIGDVHGCFYTLKEILKQWNIENEHLIFVGDLIDRGNYSAKVVKKCMQLQQAYPNCSIIKGNHEYEFIEHHDNGPNLNWIQQGGDQTLEDFNTNHLDHQEIRNWFAALPLKFETENIMITHAGITETEDPYEEDSEDSVLWNRKGLKNIHKLQIHGHTPLKQEKPLLDPKSNSVNIDTGAVYGYGLTGLKISEEAVIIDIITAPTDARDIRK